MQAKKLQSAGRQRRRAEGAAISHFERRPRRRIFADAQFLCEHQGAMSFVFRALPEKAPYHVLAACAVSG
jgi:hypothetical protein